MCYYGATVASISTTPNTVVAVVKLLPLTVSVGRSTRQQSSGDSRRVCVAASSSGCHNAEVEADGAMAGAFDELMRSFEVGATDTAGAAGCHR